tara:strand:+ start:429 stop:563 length:135 start_codon:yes stop_codon:yes gene_type:complete
VLQTNFNELRAFNSARKQLRKLSEDDMKYEDSVKNYITVNEKIS